MHSTAQDLPGSGGHGTAARLRAALGMVRAGLDEALSTPTGFLEARDLGELISELTVEENRAAALKLSWVRQAEASDIAKTTGAATTAAWLRNSQRMGKKDSYATVALARDLDRTITLTARALARGELSFRHAQVIAAAISDLPKWVSLEQRVEGENYLIAESKRRNPDDIRTLGKHLLQVLAPEEWEKRLGKELGDEERAAERSRSLRYIPNGIPGSETVVIKLPVLEMEVLRKLIETLITRDNSGTGTDERPLDQKRGDAFAQLIACMAEWEASSNRGRGRDCVTVLIHLQQLMNGTGFGTIEDLNPVRPMPCNCQTADAQRQAQRKARKNAKRARRSESAESGPSATPGDTRDAQPDKSRGDTQDAKPATHERSNETGDTGGTPRRPAPNADCGDDHRGPEPDADNSADNATDAHRADGTNATDGAPGGDGISDIAQAPIATGGTAEPDATSELGSSTGMADTDNCGEDTGPVGDVREAGGERTTAGPNSEAFKEKPPPEAADPTGAAGRIPAPREPGQPPQPNTATGTTPRPDAEPEPATEPDDWTLGAEDAAELEVEEGAAGPEAAIDPHDGCRTCGGGGSARIIGLRGEPISVATIRRMACDANIIPVVLGGNGEVLDVGMADRLFTEPQRRALAVRDGSHCHFPGCQVPERRCVAHHMKFWDDLGPTNLDNGVLLCRTHHTSVHHNGWTVRMGSHGHPEYTPPEWVDPHQNVQRP